MGIRYVIFFLIFFFLILYFSNSGFFLKFYLFIYLWLCWVFISVRGLPLVAASGGHSSSRCAGLSLSQPLLLRSTGSRRAGSVIVAHGPSCSAACGIFPDQDSNPCPLHWQADSQPLRHQGSPTICFWDPAFDNFGCTPRSRTAGSYSNSSFNFLRNCHTVFHIYCTILHSHRQYTRVPIFPHPHWFLLLFCIAVILMGVRWFHCGFDMHFPND